MKLFQKINEELERLSIDNKYIDLMLSKCEGADYARWKELMSNTKFCGEQVLNDTTGQNIGFAAFCIMNWGEGNVSVHDVFYIQKSKVLDLFVLFVKSRVTISQSDSWISYPTTLISSYWDV